MNVRGALEQKLMKNPKFLLIAALLILIVVCALFVLLSNDYPADTKSWANIALGGVLGAILGSRFLEGNDR